MSLLKRTTRPGQSTIGNWIGIILIVLIAAGIGGFFLVRSIYRGSVLSPYQASLSEFLAARPNGVPAPQPFKAGFITIDATANTFDDFFFDLPDKLKPANPEGVKTIVFLRWHKEQTHKYSNGASGYTHTCQVEVVDRATKAFLGQQQFRGGPPPATIRGRSGSGEGSRPTAEIVQYLSTNVTN